MPLYQRVEENENIAKRLFLNFNDFIDRRNLEFLLIKIYVSYF